MPVRRLRVLSALILCLALGACVRAEDVRQATLLLDPPDVPTDSPAARIEASRPYPNIFAPVTPRPAPMTAEEQERLEQELDAERETHVGQAEAEIESRR